MILYGRYEWVEKSAHELSLDEPVYGEDAVFPVNLFAIGFGYDLFHAGRAKVALGGQFTLYSADRRLNDLYGKKPMGMEVYLRLYPMRM